MNLRHLFLGLTLASVPVASALGQGARDGTGNTVVDVAIGAGNFETLVKAIEAAGLVETLKGKGHVVTTDIKASNGVIHVIDAVLLP